MPLQNPFRRLTASTSTVDDLSVELGRLDRIRLDAQNALYDIGAKRPNLLIDGTDAALAKLDGEMATARRALEQAEARIAVVEPEWRTADQRETEARIDRERRDRRAKAVKARAEGVKILADYETAAAALAVKLRRLVEIEAEIDAANLDLPPDAAPIDGAEPFNGRHATADVWPEHDVWVDLNGNHRGVAMDGRAPPVHGATRKTVYDYTATPGAPGYAHRALTGRVVLPAVDPDAVPFWAPGATAPRPIKPEPFFLSHGIRR